MFSLLLAWSTQTAAVAPVVYIPTARLQLAWPMPVEPVVATDKVRETANKELGGVVHYQWESGLASGLCTIYYSKFDAANPPKQSLKARAESMFALSKDFADGMMKIDPKGDWMKIHEEKFANRTVKDRKVGGYDGFLDINEDKRGGVIRRLLAFGDAKEQWLIELNLASKPDSMKEILDKIVDSVKVAPLSADVLKSAPLTPQVLKGADVKISAPGAFAAFARPNLTPTRKGTAGITYNQPVGNGFEIQVQYDAYDDKERTDTAATAAKLLEGMKGPGLDVKASKITTIAVGPYTGHCLRADYVLGADAMYGISVVLSRGGADVIAHIQVAKNLGGKERADAILATLKMAG